METYDVVVVGAGLAGLHAASRAARRGLAVLLIDRKARLDASIHTTGIFVRRTLDDFALPEHLPRSARSLRPAPRSVAFGADP